jgi:hypothetical protein
MSATQQSVKSVQGVQGIRDGSQLLVRRPFSVDDYHRMAETGLLGEDERTELLDGEVVVLMPISSRHAGCVNALCRWFVARLLDRGGSADQGAALRGGGHPRAVVWCPCRPSARSGSSCFESDDPHSLAPGMQACLTG